VRAPPCSPSLSLRMQIRSPGRPARRAAALPSAPNRLLKKQRLSPLHPTPLRKVNLGDTPFDQAQDRPRPRLRRAPPPALVALRLRVSAGRGGFQTRPPAPGPPYPSGSIQPPFCGWGALIHAASMRPLGAPKKGLAPCRFPAPCGRVGNPPLIWNDLSRECVSRGESRGAAAGEKGELAICDG
jgi:hypothetical protein